MLPVTYQLFGVGVASEVALPLPRTASPAAVNVVLGSVAVGGQLLWQSTTDSAMACYRRGDELVLAWPSARFLIGRNRVIVDAEVPGDAVALLLQPVWSVVLATLGREALHGGAVELKGQAIAVLGHSGAGKTTACLGLLDRGWRLVADDLLSIDTTGCVAPGPPFVRVTPDRAMGRRGRRDADGKVRVRQRTCSDAVPVSALVVLGMEHERWARLSGTAAVGALLGQVYCPPLTLPGQALRRLELATDLASRVPVYAAPPRSLTVDQLELVAEETSA